VVGPVEPYGAVDIKLSTIESTNDAIDDHIIQRLQTPKESVS